MTVIVYVEIVSGKGDARSIAMHPYDPTNEDPIPCFGEDCKKIPILNRRIVGIEINKGIIQRFLEEGLEPQTEKGLRMPISEESQAVIGESFIKAPELK